MLLGQEVAEATTDPFWWVPLATGFAAVAATLTGVIVNARAEPRNVRMLSSLTAVITQMRTEDPNSASLKLIEESREIVAKQVHKTATRNSGVILFRLGLIAAVGATAAVTVAEIAMSPTPDLSDRSNSWDSFTIGGGLAILTFAIVRGAGWLWQSLKRKK